MKKRLRTLLCTGVLSLLLCGSALAAQPPISIELNGVPLAFSDAAPQIVSDRTYLPFRAVFTALGFEDENITFDSQTRTVSAVGEELTVSMVIGENSVTVVRDGEAQVLTTDVPAFIDPQLGRTYVPVNFVAQAVGYRVGWDGEMRTVIVDDVEGILRANSESYTLLGKYMDYSRNFQSRNYRMEGDYLQQTVSDGMLSRSAGSYTMLMAGTAGFDFEMTMELTQAKEGEEPRRIIPEQISLEMRGDMHSGSFYFRSNTLTPVLGEGFEQVWMKVESLQGVSPLPVQSDAGAAGLFPDSDTCIQGIKAGDYVDGLVREMLEKDISVSAGACLAEINAVLGDSAFVRKDDKYVNQVRYNGESGSITLYTTDNRVSGYSIFSRSVDGQTGEILEQTTTVKGDTLLSQSAVYLNGVQQQLIRMSGTCLNSNDSPVTAPGEGDPVLDLTQLMGENNLSQ